MLLIGGCSGCGSEPNINGGEPLRVHGMVAFPSETVRFNLPATTFRCSDDNSVLLQGVNPEGTGVLLRVRYRDSLVSDSYPVAIAEDIGKVPAAIVAVRYFVRETPHAFVVDSGSVVVRRVGDKIGARIKGSGLENAVRTPTSIEYEDVPLRPDTVTCGYAP